MRQFEIEKALRHFFTPYSDSKFLLALSGGSDSVALFHLMLTLNLHFEIAHVNYTLRDSESDLDEQFVKKLAKKHGITAHFYKIDEGVKASLKQGNLQEKARKIRMRFFDEIHEKHQINYLVFAHQQDDQIEDFYLKLARNAGVSGLSGMKKVNKNKLRPLLEIEKNALKTYLETNNYQYREDSSNKSSDYRRNKLRNIIIPQLEKEIPTLKSSILSIQKTFRENHRIISKKIKPLIEKFKADGEIVIEEFEKLNASEQYEFVKSIQQKSELVLRLNELIKRPEISQTIILQDDQRLIKENRSFVVQKNKELPKIEIEVLNQAIENTEDICIVDAEKVIGNLNIRSIKTGDKMQMLGMKSKKLISKILKDKKIPLAQRTSYFVIEDNEKIIWLSNLCVSEETKYDHQTVKYLKISLIHE